MAETIRIEKAALPVEGKAVTLMANGTAIAVFRVGASLYALDDRCTHVGGPLHQGSVQGLQVTCPWHGSVFELKDGKVVRGPATRGATAYRVSQEGDTLILERD